MTKLDRLEKMIGNTYRYNDRNITVTDVRVSGTRAKIEHADGEIDLDMNHLEDELTEFYFKKENKLMKHVQVEDSVMTSVTTYDKMASVLMDTVDKLQADAEYIEQAKAINSTIGTLIDLETVKIKTLMMLNK